MGVVGAADELEEGLEGLDGFQSCRLHQGGDGGALGKAEHEPGVAQRPRREVDGCLGGALRIGCGTLQAARCCWRIAPGAGQQQLRVLALYEVEEPSLPGPGAGDDPDIVFAVDGDVRSVVIGGHVFHADQAEFAGAKAAAEAENHGCDETLTARNGAQPVGPDPEGGDVLVRVGVDGFGDDRRFGRRGNYGVPESAVAMMSRRQR